MAAKNLTQNMKLKTFENIFGNNTESSERKNDSVMIKIDLLNSFENHPFRVVDDEEMAALVDSIMENGVITPIEVRTKNGGYEIISGHRRTYASKKAGLTEIPAIIKEMNDYQAVIHMTLANMYREKIYPSDRAKAYKMQYDALKEMRKAEKTANPDIGRRERTDAELAKMVGESRNNIQRYIRLTYLTDEWLLMVDEDFLSFTVAQPLTHIDATVQSRIYQLWNAFNRPKLNQAITEELYVTYTNQDRKLSDNDISVLLGVAKVEKTKPVKVTLNEKRLSQFFPETYSQEDIENVIESLLQEWAEKNHTGNRKETVQGTGNEPIKGQYKFIDTNMTTDME